MGKGFSASEDARKTGTESPRRGWRVSLNRFVWREMLPDNPRAVLSGPNLALEIMAGFAAGPVVACGDAGLAKELQGLFNSGPYRVYTTHDLIGVLELAEHHGVEVPIAREIERVMEGKATAMEAYRGLVRQPPGSELSGPSEGQVVNP